MGMMTKQWVNRGNGERDRSFCPIKVSIKCAKKVIKFSNEDTVLLLSATVVNYEVQYVYFSPSEVANMVTSGIDVLDKTSKLAILKDLLKNTSNQDLFEILAQDFDKRRA